MAAANISEVNYNEVFGDSRQFIYQDDQCVVYDELLHPQAPVHFVVVPRKKMPRLHQVSGQDEKLLGHLLLVAQQQAQRRGIANSHHLMVEENYRAKSLKAVHVFGRALHHMVWPSGPCAKL